jgi:hypothetical protein
LYSDQRYETIFQIIPSAHQDDIYLVVQSTDAFYVGHLAWHIVRLNPDGSLTTVYENKNEEVTSSRLEKVDFSPDRTKSALISSDEINGGFCTAPQNLDSKISILR